MQRFSARCYRRGIDAWVTLYIAPLPFIKTSFKRGLSRYLYGSMTNDGEAWGTTVQFGKITSKDTWRDIMRFWRILIVDLFPKNPAMQTVFELYFEWVVLVQKPLQTGAPAPRDFLHASLRTSRYCSHVGLPLSFFLSQMPHSCSWTLSVRASSTSQSGFLAKNLFGTASSSTPTGTFQR